jgi:hypothetical protein
MYISSIGQSPCKRLFISRLFTWFFSLFLRKVLRYQRGKQKHKKEDGQTIEKRHTVIYKTLHELQTKQEWIKVLRKDKQFQIHLWHSSCYTCHEWEKDGNMITTNEKFPYSFVTQIFCKGYYQVIVTSVKLSWW